MSTSISDAIVCASPQQLEVYNSKAYMCALFFNLIIAILSIIISLIAARRLISDSIIHSSTRIFLSVGLIFCLMHQVAYIILRIQIIHQMFFKLDKPCELYYKSYDCKPITFGLVFGNCGMILIQTAMTLERLMATIMTRLWQKLKYYPGIMLSIIVGVANKLTYDLIFWNEPFTDTVPTCGSFPSHSVGRFMTFLAIGFYMSIGHMVINILILYMNIRQERKQRCSFNVNDRYQSRSTVKSTQSIFFLSMSQFFSMLLYTVLTEFFLQIQPKISPLEYSLALALIYTTPYTCLIIPSLIIFTLSFIKKQRLRDINTMTTTIVTQDEHLKSLKKIWD